MYLGIQPNLVERTVFEAARKDSAIKSLYERQFADCYKHIDGARREQAFSQLHERWFDVLALRDLILSIVGEFPLFRDRVDRLMVAQAPGPKSQVAELFGTEGQYTVVIAVAPASLLDRPAFLYWARHEFMHVEDMLNPAFEYDANHRPAGTTIAAKNLLQDRYAVLWATAVDARLAQRGQLPDGIREKRKGETLRAFGLDETKPAAEVFVELWEKGQQNVLTHRNLLDWARDGLPGCEPQDREVQNAARTPTLGAACPLCGFSTFDWTSLLEGDPAIHEVSRDFPNWTRSEGICTRCAEVYRACVGSAGAGLAHM
jgi:hypothetical protein